MSDEVEQVEFWRLEAVAREVRLSPVRVRHYLEVGLVQPARVRGRVALFGQPEIVRLRKVRRLRDDLGLNDAGVEVALRLLDEIEGLRAELERRRKGSTATRAGPGDE